MGDYIDPADGKTKEEFIADIAAPITQQEFLDIDFDTLCIDGRWAIAWVNNGLFTAAMVCHNQYDLNRVKRTTKGDVRPQKFYTAPIDQLIEFVPGGHLNG